MRRKYIVLLTVTVESDEQDPIKWNWPNVIDGQADALYSYLLGEEEEEGG